MVVVARESIEPPQSCRLQCKVISRRTGVPPRRLVYFVPILYRQAERGGIFGFLDVLFCVTYRTARPLERTDVLQLSGWLAGDVKESRNGNPTRDLQMAADRSRPHTLC